MPSRKNCLPVRQSEFFYRSFGLGTGFSLASLSLRAESNLNFVPGFKVRFLYNKQAASQPHGCTKVFLGGKITPVGT
jgi:hypothetical protein